MSDIDLDRTLKALRLAADQKRFRRFDFFTPVPKQLEFLAMGKTIPERMLMAGNGNGKTETAAFETACHMTGEYPTWWPGYRFTKPIQAWAASESASMQREGSQTKLIGKAGIVEAIGTGMIPREAIIGEPQKARGEPDTYDSVQVRCKVNGRLDASAVSRLVWKTYRQEREYWQGADVDLMWFDEVPPMDRYQEGSTRLRGRGLSLLTCTPMTGMTDVIRWFLDQEHPLRGYIQMGLDDTTWYSEQEIASQLARYLPHEMEARRNGSPMQGEGKVYTAPRSLLEWDAPPRDQISKDWVKIWGIDFGVQGFAAVLLACDRETDDYYVLEARLIADQIPLIHAQAIKDVAANVPVAWPFDGHSRDRMGGGEQMASIYKSHGLSMLKDHATHKTGGFAVYPGVRELDETMRAGRFHVDRRLSAWFREYDGYHYEDNKIVKAFDHLMDATRYAWMMRRKAEAVALGSARLDKRRLYLNRPTGQDFNPHTGKATYRYGNK